MENVDPQSAPRPRHLHPRFSGSATEYFKIWIVNTLLTIVTLGFYIPWAKVRTRRYFYLNTTLDDEPFDYLADPKKLFYGYLIVVVFLIGYNYLPTINPLFALPFAIIAMFGFPWIIYKSRRFFCRNSAYRNIRMRFNGELGESYAAYLGYPMLAGITLGIMMPHAFFKQKEFFFSNVAFGNIRSVFSARIGYFYKVYLIAGAIGIGLMVLMMACISGLTVATLDTEQVEVLSVILPFFILALYAGMFLCFQFVSVLITNHCWNHTSFPGHLHFNSRINPWKLIWIQLSNAIISLFSLGLLLPWAKVRVYRYRVSCLHAHARSDLSEVAAGIQNSDDGAMGDMAADQFDFEIGL
jgi:uncharacterized membrane protein YjgN (DUF898 family)